MTDRTLRTARAYLASHARADEGGHRPEPPVRPFVTISRQCGAGAGPVSKALARILTEREMGTPGTDWTVFDQAILHKIVEEDEFPESLVRDLESRGVPPLEGILTDLFGVWPSVYDLMSKTSQMVLHLAHLGNAIVIGRAGNIVTRNLHGGLHVRLVGSFWRRVRYVQEHEKLTVYDAEKFVEKTDDGRRKYLKRYFDRDIDDPTHYDLVLNTDRLGHEGAAGVIADALGIKVAAEAKAK